MPGGTALPALPMPQEPDLALRVGTVSQARPLRWATGCAMRRRFLLRAQEKQLHARPAMMAGTALSAPPLHMELVMSHLVYLVLLDALKLIQNVHVALPVDIAYWVPWALMDQVLVTQAIIASQAHLHPKEPGFAMWADTVLQDLI